MTLLTTSRNLDGKSGFSGFVESVINSELRNISIEVAKESEHPVNIQLFECAINSFSSSAYYDLKSLAEKIIPLTDNSNPLIQKDGFRLLNLINQKVNMLGRQIGVDEAIEKAKTHLTNNDVKAKPFLDFVFGYSDKLTSGEKRELTNLIEQQIDVGKPNQIRLLSLQYIEKIDDNS